MVLSLAGIVRVLHPQVLVSVLAGTNEGVWIYCGTQVVAWLESTRQQNCFYWKENIPKLLQRKQNETGHQ